MSARDVRLFGVAITVGIVALGGAGLALLPAGPSPRQAATVAPAHGAEIDAAFGQGVAMLHARRFDHALAAFHRVLRFAPDMPEAHANMGFALAGLGRHREARSFFEGAIALRSRQLNAYYGLAQAAAASGDLETARGAMRTYVHLAAPEDPFRRRGEEALRGWSAPGQRTAEARP